MAEDKITVVGAREHNLKNISVEIPRDKLVVISGISGSRDTPRQARRHLRHFRVREIIACFRYNFRRRTAPLCRIIVGLCAAILGAAR